MDIQTRTVSNKTSVGQKPFWTAETTVKLQCGEEFSAKAYSFSREQAELISTNFATGKAVDFFLAIPE